MNKANPFIFFSVLPVLAASCFLAGAYHCFYFYVPATKPKSGNPVFDLYTMGFAIYCLHLSDSLFLYSQISFKRKIRTVYFNNAAMGSSRMVLELCMQGTCAFPISESFSF